MITYMKVVMVSNYLNHHQIPFSNELYDLTQGNYSFIQTCPMEDERKKMGWAFNKCYPYLIQSELAEKNKERALELINSADVVIHGSVSTEPWVKERIEKEKLTFLYAERIFKKGQWRRFSPNGRKVMQKEWLRYEDHNVYVLSASAYLPDDLHFFNAYENKIFKWGYFPEFIPMQSLKKEKNSKVKILWAARFIGWKHPEQVVLLGKKLIKKGCSFDITMIGNGPLLDKIKQEVKTNNLEDCFTFTGALSPDKVRKLMIASDIFVATSDYQEGWGAVINEAMNSRCAIVASHAMGAVPYLLEDNVNALIFKSGDNRELAQCVENLINDPSMRVKLANNAYETLEKLWSPKKAAKAFICLTESLLQHKDVEMEGVCSHAPRIQENKMYTWLKEGKKI